MSDVPTRPTRSPEAPAELPAEQPVDLWPFDGFDRHLGLRLVSVTSDEAVGTLDVRPELLQPVGLLHGGVLCSIVESLGSWAGQAWFGERGGVVGTSNHTNLLRSTGVGDRLTGRATPVHRGRTSQLWSVEVRDQRDRLVAKGDLRLANLPAGGAESES